VIVLDSGVPVRLVTWEGGRTSPIEVRGAATAVGGGGCEQRALYRREESLGFLAFLVLSLSLLMTSAKALLIDARFRDCRMELRVVGLDFGGVIAAVLNSAGIVEMKQLLVKSMLRLKVSFLGISQLFVYVCASSLPHKPSHSFPTII